MRFGYADCSWDYWVLDFGLYDSESCLFLCLFSMRSFVVQIFSFFRTLYLDVFIVVTFISSSGLDRSRSGFAL